MAQPFKRIAQFFKRNAPAILTAAGQPELAVVVKVAEAVADAKAAPVEAPAPAQVLQGGVTFMGLGVALVAYALQHWDLVPAGYDATATATVLVGVAVAAYGRIRREFRA